MARLQFLIPLLWNKKLNERIKSLPKKIIFLDKDLRYFVGICFFREEGNLCIFQENLFLRLRAFYRFLTVYFCKNSVFEYIRILSWFEAKKNTNISVLEVLVIFFLCENIKNFTKINFSGSGHFEYFLKPIFYLF